MFSIDLIGFGFSSKPSRVDFSMEFWRDQIANFVSEVVKEPVALVGNSIGSLAAVHVGQRNAGVGERHLFNQLRGRDEQQSETNAGRFRWVCVAI